MNGDPDTGDADLCIGDRAPATGLLAIEPLVTGPLRQALSFTHDSSRSELPTERYWGRRSCRVWWLTNAAAERDSLNNVD